MSLNAVFADTPSYVLRDENRPIGPQVVPLPSGIECLPVYGFSNKTFYDTFGGNGQQTLKPYPLVKGFLRAHVDAPGNGLKLVVIDAAGPGDPYLLAATMNAVLEAQEKRSTEVTVAYRLVFDHEVGAYRVQEASA